MDRRFIRNLVSSVARMLVHYAKSTGCASLIPRCISASYRAKEHVSTAVLYGNIYERPLFCLLRVCIRFLYRATIFFSSPTLTLEMKMKNKRLCLTRANRGKLLHQTAMKVRRGHRRKIDFATQIGERGPSGLELPASFFDLSYDLQIEIP